MNVWVFFCIKFLFIVGWWYSLWVFYLVYISVVLLVNNIIIWFLILVKNFSEFNFVFFV